MVGVDAFTEVVRYVAWIGGSILFLFVVGMIGGSAVMRWYRRQGVRHHHRVYDWKRDGECYNGYPESHVHLIEAVPYDWWEQWT